MPLIETLPIIAIIIAPIKDLVDIIDKLGIIQTVKAKLIAKPDEAARHLLIVLAEISKIFLALETEMTCYLTLTMERGYVVKEREVLMELAGGQASVRAAQMRGSCGKIHNIYIEHLDKWFPTVLEPAEQRAIEELFTQMSLTDSMMVKAIEELSNWLKKEATTTLKLVNVENFLAAQDRVQAAWADIMPTRQMITKALGEIHSLEADFIKRSGAV